MSTRARTGKRKTRATFPRAFSAAELEMAERLRTALEGRTISEIGDAIDMHPESIRRVLRGMNRPPARFLALVCEHMDISAEWLLLGRGSMYGGPAKTAARRGRGGSRAKAARR